jgi:hypothetical protein
MHVHSGIKQIAVTACVVATAVGGGGYALASTSSVHSISGTAYAGCVKTSGTPIRILFDVHAGNPVTCPRGSFRITWNQNGPQGPAGPAGPAGPQGLPGSDALLTVQATTTITAWPESSGWADDNFTRIVSLTRQHAASASHCGASATQCWFYTEALADNGTFTTVDGHASPNGSSSDTIHGADQGTMVGGGKLEFYASSDIPNPSLVPATANGSAKPSSTTDWYKLFFAAGTQFGLASGSNAPWLTYDWLYTATSPNTCEAWNDGINPGDDGQGAGDGNITGVSHC